MLVRVQTWKYKQNNKKRFQWINRAHFLSLVGSKLRLCSANHRAGYWSNLPCDWPSTAWAYSEQETENRPRSLDVPAAKAASLELANSRLRSLDQFLTCNQKVLVYPHFQSCTNSNSPSWTNFSVAAILAFSSLKHCLCSLPSSQQLRASGIQFSMPLMCTARISNSHLAATNSSSLRQPCRNELCVLPVLSTGTEVLSHWITIRYPRHVGSHTHSQQFKGVYTKTPIGNALWKLCMEIPLLRVKPCPSLVYMHPSPPPHLAPTTFTMASLTPRCIGEETPSTTTDLSWHFQVPQPFRPWAGLAKTPAPLTWTIILV